MDARYFSKKVVKWYKENHRSLPWRITRDPYRIWLSEIILQQTRVSQGLPYYERFVAKYPTVGDLARAPEQEVLRLWQGLGYYTRARNLYRCAQQVYNELNGIFPDNFDGLRKLPGVGDYTAAAIASIAHRQPVAVVDGNVYRVLARSFGIATPIDSTGGKKEFFELANRVLDKTQPDIHNQAMMEFGALHCTPKAPGCSTCVLQTSCEAYRGNLQEALPVKSNAKKSRKRYFYYLVFQQGKSLALKKRDQKDIWHGLYDFALIEKDRPAKIDTLTNEPLAKLLLKKKKMVFSEDYKHILTHQTIHAQFIVVTVNTGFKPPENFSFYSPDQIADLPKPVLISRFLSDHDLL
jgi:A/G-specific adenine glycosylase